MPSALLQKTPYGSFGGQPGGTLSQYKNRKAPDPSVMDKEEELPLTAEELARSIAEKDALQPPMLGPISIDPTDWLTPGGLAKVGAVLKGVLTGASASPLLVGAFRSANDTMLARGLVSDIKSGVADKIKHLEASYSRDYPNSENQVIGASQLLGKLSNKEISKYGTPEFKLDKWLPSTENLPNQMPKYMRELTPEDVIRQGHEIQDLNNTKANLVKQLEAGTLSPFKASVIKDRVIPGLDRQILEHSEIPFVEDLLLAQKQGKRLLDTPYPRDPINDIESGAMRLVASIQKHGIPIETVEKNSLQQIVSKVNQADDDAVRVLKKSMEAKSQIISKRTAELAAKQSTDAEGGFVRLETPQDLAQETDVLNHCIGAVGRDNDKYIPAFDTVTGKANKKRGATSFDDYKDRLEQGASEFYSYRPKGLPEVTLEVQNPSSSNGKVIKTISQAYGKEDRALTPQEGDAVAKFAREMGIGFNRKRFVEEPELRFPPDDLDVNENGPFWLP